LTGFELEIANVANRAGFDTRKHEQLFDLIWAVKRLALRVNKPRPPKDPMYPDRWRPEESKDQPQQRRKTRVVETVRDHSVELQFYPIKPLMRKRPLDNLRTDPDDKTTRMSGRRDVAAPVKIPSSPTNVYKRQKMEELSRPTLPPKAHLHPSISAPGGNAKIKTSAPKPKSKNRGNNHKVRRQLEHRSAAPVVSTFSRHESGLLRTLPATTASSAALYTVTRARDDITRQLIGVKAKLEEAGGHMNNCQATMKALFDTHYRIFDGDDMMNALRNLSDHMNRVYEGSKSGAVEVDRVLALMDLAEGEIL
jgi:hypothetical protein